MDADRQAEEHARRLQEREDEVRTHNERTGGGDVNEGELKAQQDEHQERVNNDVPNPDTDDPDDQVGGDFVDDGSESGQ